MEGACSCWENRKASHKDIHKSIVKKSDDKKLEAITVKFHINVIIFPFVSSHYFDINANCLALSERKKICIRMPEIGREFMQSASFFVNGQKGSELSLFVEVISLILLHGMTDTGMSVSEDRA
jgi:hypothetical protein